MDVELESLGNEHLHQMTMRPMGLAISARRWYGAAYDEPTGEPSQSPTEAMDPMTAEERLTSITRLLALNQALGNQRHPGMVDIADAFTRYPNETNSDSDDNEE